MNTVWLSLNRGADKPDLIVADNNYYRLYLQSLQSIQRITDGGNSSAGAGFASLKYYGAGMASDVVLDGGPADGLLVEPGLGAARGIDDELDLVALDEPGPVGQRVLRHLGRLVARVARRVDQPKPVGDVEDKHVVVLWCDGCA